MNAQRALVLSIAAGLVVVAGIVMGVLIYHLSETVLNGTTSMDDNTYSSMHTIESGPIWMGGLVYVIPGVFCFIAAFLQNKCFYVTSCVIAMIFLVLMGLVIVFLGIPLFWILVAFHNLHYDCAESLGNCECRMSRTDAYETTPFRDCEYLRDFTNLGIGLSVITTIAWIFLVGAFIIACVFACRSKRSGGVVMAPAEQPMLKR